MMAAIRTVRKGNLPHLLYDGTLEVDARTLQYQLPRQRLRQVLLFDFCRRMPLQRARQSRPDRLLCHRHLRVLRLVAPRRAVKGNLRHRQACGRSGGQ